MNYMIAQATRQKNHCRLGSLQNVTKDYQLRFGISRAGDFPADAAYPMDEDYPKAVALADLLDNDARMLVVSGRFRTLLEEIPGALFANEVLPVKIINHKGREEKAPYFIIHQVSHPACLDEAKSVGERSPINPEHYQFMDQMILDESKIDPKLMLFRVAQFPAVPLVRRDLVDTLKRHKLTGITFHEIAGYDFL